MSLKSTIYEYVKSQYPDCVHKGILGRKAVNEWGYENENSGRRCRDLVAEKKLEPIYNRKGEVMYRWVPHYLDSPPKEIRKQFYNRELVAQINSMETKKEKVEKPKTLFT